MSDRVVRLDTFKSSDDNDVFTPFAGRALKESPGLPHLFGKKPVGTIVIRGER